MVYSTDATWGDARQPMNTATVRDLIALNPAAERALWHFVCSVDWITTVRSGNRAPDDLLPLLLPDPRAARTVTHTDWLWVRLLDVRRALEARSYEREASLVLDVRDEGEWPRGASCWMSRPPGRVAPRPPGARISPWEPMSWRPCISATSRPGGWWTWGGPRRCGPVRRSRRTPSSVRGGGLGARTSSDPFVAVSSAS